MKIDEWTSEDVHTSGGGEFPPCAGLTSNALPEAQSTVSAESSLTGVSTRNAHITNKIIQFIPVTFKINMKHSLSILFLAFFFMTVLSSCEKKEILELKTVWGEATINNNCLFQYTTVGEGLSHTYWFLPLGVNNNICIVKEGVCYFQMFLRDYEEKDADNFWLILIGCYADEKFPIIGKEYKIVVQDQVNLGNIGISFYESGKLRDFYSENSEFVSYGIAGLSIPPSHEKFIPLAGSIKFVKGDTKSGEYSISYSLKSEDNSASDTYSIMGKFNGKLKVIK